MATASTNFRLGCSFGLDGLRRHLATLWPPDRQPARQWETGPTDDCSDERVARALPFPSRHCTAVAKCFLGNGLRDTLGIGAGPAEDCRSCAGLTFLAASQEWHPIGTWSGE
jgi:hypothetical protein